MRQLRLYLLGAFVSLMLLAAINTAWATRRSRRPLLPSTVVGTPRRHCLRVFVDVKARLHAWGTRFRADALRARLREIFKSATRMPIVDRDNANVQFTRAKRGGLLLTLWISLN